MVLMNERIQRRPGKPVWGTACPFHSTREHVSPTLRPDSFRWRMPYLSVQTQFIFSRAILDQMIWFFKITKWNHHRFRVEWMWSFPYDDQLMPPTHVRWNQIKGDQDVAICNTVLHLQACSLGLLHLLLFAGCHSLGTVDLDVFCFVLLSLLLLTMPNLWVSIHHGWA